MNLDLSKKLDERKDKILNLSKTIGLRNQKSTVVLALDYSGSMDGLYYSGKVQELVERVLPLGLAFDDNGEVDFYIFQNSVTRLPENITLANVEGYIKDKVYRRYTMGGTSYAPVIKQIVSKFKPSSGLLSGPKPLDYPVYVLFVTDGENDDRASAEKELIEASKYGIFFQFIGIGGASFSFLKKLDNLQGRRIDNANFCEINSPSSLSDDELYALLLKEYPGFVMEAKRVGLVKNQ